MPTAKSGPARLPHSTVLLLTGNAIYAGAQWLTIVVLARTLGDSAVGYYSLSLALAAPVMLLVGMSLRSVLQAQPHIASHRTFVEIRWCASGLGILAITVLAAGSDAPLSLTLFFVGCAKALDLFGDLCAGLLVQRGRAAAASMILATNGILTVALAAALSAALGSVVAVAAGSLVASALSSVLLPLVILRGRLRSTELNPRTEQFANHQHRRVLRASVPLGFASAIGSVASNIPVYALGLSDTIKSVGAFSAAMSLLLLAQMPLQARQQAELSSAARLRLQGDDAAIRRLLRSSLGIAALSATATVGLSAVIGPGLLTLLYGSQFSIEPTVLVLLAVALVPSFFVWTLDLALWVLELGKRQLIVNVAAAATGAVTAWLLVPSHGLLGAIGAVACISCVQFVAKSYYVERGLRFDRLAK